MAATFDAALTTAKDRVRLSLGDFTLGKFLIQDETIEALLLTPMGELATAARLARVLSAQFAREGDFTVDGQGQKNSEKSKAYALLADRLERDAAAVDGDLVASDTYISGGIIVTGATSDDVMDARSEMGRAANAPLRFP